MTSSYERKTERPRVLWTPEEDAVIVKGIAEGTSYAEMLDNLPGRTRGSVGGRAARLRIMALPIEERRAKRGQPEPMTAAERGAKRRSRLSGQTKVQAPKSKVRSPKVIERWIPRESLLPYKTTKEGTLLHVYARDPHVLMPLASFERSGSGWTRRDDPSQKFTSIPEAVRAMEPV